jgi:hypothetical protein
MECARRARLRAAGVARPVLHEPVWNGHVRRVRVRAPAWDILRTFYKGTTKHHVIRRIHFVTPDVAIVDIDNQVRGVRAMPAGVVVPRDGIVKTQLMEVLVRRGEDGGSRLITTWLSRRRIEPVE